MVATVYQTHVIAQQFSATVWPYVSFDDTTSPWSFEVDLRNDGLGPAIVRSVRITLDGKPQASLETLLARLSHEEPQSLAAVRAALRAGTKVQITTSTPQAGLVVPANAQHVVIRVQGAVLVRYVGPAFKRVGISLCYCSLTGTCWTQSHQTRDTEPQAVASCGRS